MQQRGTHTFYFSVSFLFGVQVREGVGVSDGRGPSDALDHMPPTQWWGAFYLPSDLSHSDKWDNFLSQRGPWVAQD
jgi:hypothetical protein